MISPSTLAVPLLLAALLLNAIVRRLRAHSISHLPGPPSRSWLVGNFPELQRPEEIGDADFGWTKQFGTALRIKGTFGSDVLFTADAKALQYILNTSGYNFPKPPESRALTGLITGRGIVWAEGTQHTRQRKIINPAFSYGALRVFLPLFRHTAQKTAAKWRNLILRAGGTSTVVDVPGWLARTTLDSIGAAAFDYDFGAIDGGSENELAKAYSNLFADAFLNRSDYSIAFGSLLGLVPSWAVSVFQNMPTKELRRIQNYSKVARRVAKSIVDRQVSSYATGKDGSKDVMSILVRANLAEDPKTKLTEDEVLSQLTTFMLAGHETTASTITWALYELSRHPEFQNMVREEIKATRAHAAQRGDHEMSVADIDSMKYLLALMKETLRYHPIVNSLERCAGRDDIIPLGTPQTTSSGENITGIPVSKGQRVIVSIAAYNRLTSVWGEDAEVWRPERFLEGVEHNQKTGLGVVANVATFSSGLRSCIGWRFAMIEMQAILIELIENFEFSPSPGNIEIIRGATGIMSPMVKGSTTGHTELPLTIKSVM